jgi:hypothetical protein
VGPKLPQLQNLGGGFVIFFLRGLKLLLSLFDITKTLSHIFNGGSGLHMRENHMRQSPPVYWCHISRGNLPTILQRIISKRKKKKQYISLLIYGNGDYIDA